MEFFNFANKDNVLEVTVLPKEVDDLSSNGDLYVGIQVTSNGFCGINDLWLFAPDIKEFCNSLKQLEKTRLGEASLSSVIPGEFEIVVKSVDSVGHMAVSGKTGYEVIGDNISFFHCIEFGFEIDPSSLIKALKNETVAQYIT